MEENTWFLVRVPEIRISIVKVKAVNEYQAKEKVGDGFGKEVGSEYGGLVGSAEVFASWEVTEVKE